MMLLLELLLCALALPAVAAGSYLLLLTLLSSAPAAPRPAARRLKFDIVVPAHDEAAVVWAAVCSLRRIDWPADCFRVLVVADNCSDATAPLARAAGAVVIERRDAARRGKGCALEFAFAHSARHGWADAVVVVDADSEVSPNLLAAFAARIEAGAQAVQADYGVLNAMASWRTRLLAIALAAFHRVRSRGRERLGLSCGLRGNGWCVTHGLLREVPYRAFSLAEDIEYGIALGLAGRRVHHADEARADALMVTGEQASRSQRQRWESGRWQLLRAQLGPLWRAAWRQRSAVCLDLAVDLLVPPLSWIVLDVAAFASLALVSSVLDRGPPGWVELALVCGAMVTLYVQRGWQLSGVGLRGLADLLCAPWFVLWKLLLLRYRGTAQWVRTPRERP